MISSMTGFGEAAAELDGMVYTVEIKSVNNRFFKAQLKLPELAAFLEPEIEKLARQCIRRGSVNYALHIKNVSGKPLFVIDSNAVKGYIEQLARLTSSGDCQCRIDIAGLLTLPGTVLPAEPDQEQARRVRDVVLGLTKESLEQLKQTRRQEGQVLAEDMLAQTEQINEKLRLIETRRPVVVQEYRDKLKKRIEQLAGSAEVELDADVLVRETAFFADRSDIAEEITRLGSHLSQFQQCCRDGENMGRRLDFVAQEMLREANTIASKASDVQICQWVIDIKCAIDRIKEQVQNIE